MRDPPPSRPQASRRSRLKFEGMFYRSGWTQEELAAKEATTQQSIAYRMRFGRFLNFITTVINSQFTLPKNLTERRFRSFWDRTEKANGNERARFNAVLALMRQHERTVRDKDA